MIQLKKTVAAQVANALVNYKTVFLDSVDGKLKVKDEYGVVEEIAIGAGVPDGGDTGQVLAKASDIDGDFEWVDSGGGSASYLVYTALLTQSGTDAPVATVLENTLGGTVVWSYNSPGSYTGTLAGAFIENKTFFTPIVRGDGDGTNFRHGWAFRVNNDSFVLFVEAPIVEATINDGLSLTPFEIRVYP